MDWYPWWISQQYASTPKKLLSILPAGDRAETLQAFMSLWHGLGAFLSSESCTSIDGIVQHLLANSLVEQQTDIESGRLTKSLIFTMIGWQTMLFRGDCGSCQSTSFAIADEMNGQKGRVHMRLRQPQKSSREPLDRCLLGFGVLLPPKNYDMSESAEHQKAFVELKDVTASGLNAGLLFQVGRLEFRWTDCLACHLEVDLVSNCIYIFRYPSFCISSKAIDNKEKTARGPLYACAQQKSGPGQWASNDDVSDFLDEIVMSYRLLFGQNKQSRKLFRDLSPFAGMPVHAQDGLLIDLCARKQCRAPLPRAERKHWDLKYDFPFSEVAFQHLPMKCRFENLVPGRNFGRTSAILRSGLHFGLSLFLESSA